MYVEIGIINAQIPRSFNSINSTNNVLIYTLNSIIYNIIITSGNYNANTFITELNNQFALNGHTFNITLNKATGILTFSHLLYNFSFLSSTSTCNDILGFNASLVSTNKILVLQFPLNLLGQKIIKVISKTLNVSNYDHNYSSILGIIPINVPIYNIINYENRTNHMNLLNIDGFNYIDISLLDDKNNYLDFQNIEWNITLRLVRNRILYHTHNK
jgi:hypothetical protein